MEGRWLGRWKAGGKGDKRIERGRKEGWKGGGRGVIGSAGGKREGSEIREFSDCMTAISSHIC